MGTDKQPQLTDVCHLCKKPFGMHSPIRQYCPRQEDPPFEEWKVFTFTPSPEPVAESDQWVCPKEIMNDAIASFASIEDMMIYDHFYQKGRAEVSRLTSERNKEFSIRFKAEAENAVLRNELTVIVEVLEEVGEIMMTPEGIKRLRALLSPKSDKP